MELLIERHLDAAESLAVADRHAWRPLTWPTRVLRAIADAGHLPEVTRARALFGLASGLQSQRDYKESAELEIAAARSFRELATKYPRLEHRERTWAEVAAAHLYEMEHLTIGKAAPDETIHPNFVSRLWCALPFQLNRPCVRRVSQPLKAIAPRSR